MGRAAPRCYKACLYEVCANMRRKQVITMPSRDFCTFPHKSPNVHAVFERPWNFAHVFNVPLPSLLRMFFSFSLEIWDPLRPKYPKKYKTQISGEKKKKIKIPIRKRLGRGTLNTCAKFQGLSLKNGVDIGLWRNLGFYAWTSLYVLLVCRLLAVFSTLLNQIVFFFVWNWFRFDLVGKLY